VSENHTTTAAKVTAELNIHLEDYVSTKTVRRELHKSSILGRAATAKSPITGNRNMFLHVVPNITPGLCLENAQGSLYTNECLFPTTKYRGGSVMIWAAISWYYVSLVITMNGRITASDCVDILGNQVQTYGPDDVS